MHCVITLSGRSPALRRPCMHRQTERLSDCSGFPR